MKRLHIPRPLLLALALLATASIAFAQVSGTYQPLVPDQTPLSPGLSASPGTATPSLKLEVLSDTAGADLAPYVRQTLQVIRQQWLTLLSRERLDSQASHEHLVAIRLTIAPNGRISAMHLDASSGESVLDRAAWGGIAGVGQFPALPAAFTGQNLQLRLDFTSPGLAAKLNSPSAEPSPAGNLHP